MDGYKSFGSFAPLYVDATRYLIQGIDPRQGRSALAVLQELANHADPVGTCFCGIRRLAQMTRYSAPTVERALNLLSELGYVHEIQITDHYGRSKWHWIISPQVLWISPDYIDMALDLWGKSSICKGIFTKHTQPPLTSFNQQQPAVNQNNQQNHHHLTTSSKDEGFAPETDYQLEPEPQREAQASDQSTQPAFLNNDYQSTPPAQSAPSSAKRNQPKNKNSAAARSAINDPLTDGMSEAVARRLSNWGGTTLAQARGYVMQYGRDRVSEMMESIKGEKGVHNPIGIMCYRLDKGIKPEKVDFNQLLGISK
jgi:hypothetical protein